MFKKKNKVFTNLSNPSIQHIDETTKKEYNVYFVEECPGVSIPVGQMFQVDTSVNKFQIILEKELYELVPEYYSFEGLKIMELYFFEIGSKKLFLLSGGGVLVAAAGMIGANIMFNNVIIALLASLGLGVLYMFTVVLSAVKRHVYKCRWQLRQNYIQLLGEDELNKTIKKIENYLSPIKDTEV